MVDQAAVKEMNETEKKIEQHFRQLAEIDAQRTEHFYDYRKNARREDMEFFQRETVASIQLFRNIKKDFHKLLGYVLLMENEGHKSQSFQELLRRVRYLEKLLHTFYNHRRKQARIVRSLLAPEHLFTEPVSYLQKKRLILSFGKEKELVAVFVGLYKHEKERIDAIFQAYENEQKKDLAATGLSLTLAVLVPAAGTALGLAVYTAFQWANKSSANYKRLMKLLNPGEEDGS